jgi:hypothetical protein
MKRNVVCLVVALMVFVTPLVLAQEEKEEEGHVFTISTYKVQFQNVDKIMKLCEEYLKPVTAKNEYVKSFRVFTHLWGSDWTIVDIAEYESMAAIEASWVRDEEISKEMFPDGEYEEKLAEMQAMLLGHADNIVLEVPSLRK